MIKSNLDCMFLHDVFDQYCNLFKGYKNCDKYDCEVLKILKENEQLKAQIEKMKSCENCKHRYYENGINYCNNRCQKNLYNNWELAE